MPSEPAGERPRAEGEAQGLSRARGTAASSGSTWARRRRCPRSSRRRWRRSPSTRVSHRQDRGRLQLGADARRRDRLGAQLDAAFDRHAAGARRRRQGDGRRSGCGRRPTRRRGCVVQPPTSASATPRSAGRSRMPRRQRLHAHHGVRRAVHRADPAEQPVQPGEHQRADRRHAHDVLLHRVERQRRRRHRPGGVAQVLRRAGRHRSRPRVTASCARATTATCRTGRR